MGNAIAWKYLKEVKRNLPETAADKHKFLKDFEENLGSYIQERPNADREDLVQRFGSPETIAESFLPEDSTGEALLAGKKKKLRKRLVLAFFAICTIVLMALFTYRVWDRYNYYHGHYERTVGEGYASDHSDAVSTY